MVEEEKILLGNVLDTNNPLNLKFSGKFKFWEHEVFSSNPLRNLKFYYY